MIILALPCSAEELEPRRWTHLPIDTNFVGIGYVYTDAEITFDPLLKIEDGQAELHTWVENISGYSSCSVKQLGLI